MKIPRKSSAKSSAHGYLDGQMLIAMPAMNDERFARAVIYVCAHSSEGAMGIIVNQPAGNIKFPDLLVQLEVIPAAERIELPVRAEDVKVLKGGPVEAGRGFVLHSADFFIENSTLPIDEGICLTATLDILKAIARGTRPVILRSIIALAHDLGMDVVAEGAESDSDAVELYQLGCEYAQGFAFGEPMTAQAAGRLLTSDNMALARQ